MRVPRPLRPPAVRFAAALVGILAIAIDFPTASARVARPELPVVAKAVAGDGTWSPVPPPLGRDTPSMIYDPDQDRMVMYGWAGGTTSTELWELSLSATPSWSPLDALGQGPAPRIQHTAIYDPIRHRMLVFGGSIGGQAPDDSVVWSLSLSGPMTWSTITAAGVAPGARRNHSAIYDPVRDRMVVFGGIVRTAMTSTNEVWELSLSGTPTWNLLTPAGSSPSARVSHTAIYDPVADRMLVFGGWGPAPNNDVWSLTLSGSAAWTQLAPAGGPPAPRFSHTAIHDPAGDRMLVFGGLLNWSTNDSWALSLDGPAVWSQLTPSGTVPVARRDHAATYDPIRARMLVFGGSSSHYLYDKPNEVSNLALSGPPAWSEVVPGGQSPTGRWDHAAIHHRVRDRMLVVGGGTWASQSSQYPTNDTWQIPFTGDLPWGALAPNGTLPLERYGHTATYDSVRNRLILFGGRNDNTIAINDLWALSLTDSQTWNAINPPAQPTARWDHTAIYDPIRDRMLVFGGYYEHGRFPLRTLDALSLGGSPAWTSLSTYVGPSARRGHTAIYDPLGDRMVVFGGANNSTRFSEVWAFALSGTLGWTSLTPSGPAPAPRSGHSAIYDPLRDRMVVFGGSDGAAALGDVWAFSFSGTPAWSMLDPGGASPAPRREHNAVYDPLRDRMVIFGGWNGYYTYNDSWALTWGSTVDAPNPVHVTGSSRIVRVLSNPSRGPVVFEIEGTSVQPVRALAVYTVTGGLVWRMDLRAAGTGPQRITWDGRDREGRQSSAGVYFVGCEGVPADRAVRFVLMR